MSNKDRSIKPRETEIQWQMSLATLREIKQSGGLDSFLVKAGITFEQLSLSFGGNYYIWRANYENVVDLELNIKGLNKELFQLKPTAYGKRVRLQIQIEKSQAKIAFIKGVPHERNYPENGINDSDFPNRQNLFKELTDRKDKLSIAQADLQTTWENGRRKSKASLQEEIETLKIDIAHLQSQLEGN